MVRAGIALVLTLAALGCRWDAPERAPRAEARAGVTDQGENPTDLSITRRIRRALIADDLLSFSAKNAKIITSDERVTVRGRVESVAERDAVVAVARRVAGPNRVDDQLEVKD